MVDQVFLDQLRDAQANPVAFTGQAMDLTGLPESLRGGFARWWCFGIPAGDFLQGVIEGDLYRALGHADARNQARLLEIASWFYNHADARAIRKNAEAWGDDGGYFGRLRKHLEAV